MSFRPFLLACLLASPALAQTAPAPSATTAPAAVDPERFKNQCHLTVARNGKEVVVGWILPAVDIKQFEIFRNTREQALGRGRVAALRPELAIYYDTVDDAASTYWYWLKITLAGGQIVNVGPVATPSAKVWTP